MHPPIRPDSGSNRAATSARTVWRTALGLAAAIALAAAPNVWADDFQNRCQTPGVIRCVGFDQPSDIAGTEWGDNTGIDTAGWAIPVLDTTVKASGNSSLKFTIPSNSGANSSGSYWANFSTDLTTQFGENSDFYIQWRQRFSPEFLNTFFQGGGGWKQAIIGTGDNPGCTPSKLTNCSTSCSDLEVVTQNTNQRGFPQMYNSCSGSTSHGAYDAWEEPYQSLRLQAAERAPFPLLPVFAERCGSVSSSRQLLRILSK